jgi:hypothetical protein
MDDKSDIPDKKVNPREFAFFVIREVLLSPAKAKPETIQVSPKIRNPIIL